MPLRIAFDARRLHDFGHGTYIRNLLRALGEIDHHNRYLVIARRGDLPDLAGLPANFEPLPYDRDDADPREHVRFPLFARRLRADLHHLPLPVVPLWMPRPYVVTVHDLGLMLYEMPPGLRGALRRHRFRHGLRRASRVFAVSDATSRALVDVLGVSPERIRRVYSAPDPLFHPPADVAEAARREADRQRVRERYQVDGPFLLYVGHGRPQKNLPRLIEAFAVARDRLAADARFGDLRLLLVGNALSRRPDVRQALHRSRAGAAVRFLGFVPPETLRAFYEAAAAFAFPSLHEGFGLAPLEAMACGTPVLTSEVSALPEVVGDAALLVNPENVFDIAEGFVEILCNASLRAGLIERGHARLRRFRWDDTARRVLAVYREAAGQGSGAATA